jgi:hypothetical protein
VDHFEVLSIALKRVIISALMPRWLPVCFLLLFPLSLPAQTYVGRYDVFGGFTYLHSSNVNLDQRGFHFQAGFHPRRWLALGFDFSTTEGHTSLEPSELKTSLQQQLGAQIAALIAAGVIPPTYQLVVPFDSRTYTFAAGPQWTFLNTRYVGLFLRPSIGAIHEIATLHPTDPVAAGITTQLAPSGQKTDWVGFYGFGGGATFWLNKHFGIRAQADFVHNDLFGDILQNGRNVVRLSIGPAVQFGNDVQ